MDIWINYVGGANDARPHSCPQESCYLEVTFHGHLLKSYVLEWDNGKRTNWKKCYFIKILTGIVPNTSTYGTFALHKVLCKILGWTKFACQEHFTTGTGQSPPRQWWGVPAELRGLWSWVTCLYAHPILSNISSWYFFNHWIWSINLKMSRK